VPVAAPPHELIELANDKEALLKRAEQAGVPIPRTHFDARDRAAEIAASARWPLLVRPNRGSGGRGLVKVERAEDLAPAIERVFATHGSVLVQEFVPSKHKGYGCSGVVAPSHEPVALFCHRRLREYPIAGGPATIVESIHEPKLQEQAAKLLRALGWVGVAMTEWRLDERDGELKLIEINPRMWGSSHLALDAGVDVPWLLWHVHRGVAVEKVADYRAGVRRRWLVPTDMLHWWQNPERGRMNPPFWRLFEKNTRYDFLDWRDPGPTVMNVLSLARMVLKGTAKQHIDRT
jgi:predicted ATP-grasp superfamily ATP-dependent carboligase